MLVRLIGGLRSGVLIEVPVEKHMPNEITFPTRGTLGMYPRAHVSVYKRTDLGGVANGRRVLVYEHADTRQLSP